MTIKKKSLKSLKEGHQENLPVHPSGAGVQVPDKLEDKAPAKQAGSESALPTHPSDAASEIPDSLEGKLGARPVAAEVDGKKIADASGKHGNAEGSQIPEKLKEEKDEEDKEEDDKEEEKKDSEDSEESDEKEEEDLKEHIAALTRGELLPEEFKTKAATLFEAAVKDAVKARVEKARKKLEEEYSEKLSAEKEKISEALVDKVDGYLDYVVEEWMKDNEVAIESGLKAEITEKFILGLKGLFEQNYIEVPETKEDILEKTLKEKEAVEKELNEEIARGVELKKELVSIKKNSELARLCEDLTDAQASKFKKLCEGVSFEDAEQFSQKAKVIKEHYFPKEVKKAEDSTASLIADGGLKDNATQPINEKVVDPAVRAASDALSRLVRK